MRLGFAEIALLRGVSLTGRQRMPRERIGLKFNNSGEPGNSFPEPEPKNLSRIIFHCSTAKTSSNEEPAGLFSWRSVITLSLKDLID